MPLKEWGCAICDADLRANNFELYSEFSFTMSDDTLAKASVCTRCFPTLNDENIHAIFERIRETWLQQMVGWATDNQFTAVRALQVKAWDQQERNCLEKHDIVKKEEFDQKLRVAKEVKEAEMAKLQPKKKHGTK